MELAINGAIECEMCINGLVPYVVYPVYTEYTPLIGLGHRKYSAAATNI